MDPLPESTAVVALADCEEKSTETETVNEKGETKDGRDVRLDIEEKIGDDAGTAEDTEASRVVRVEDGGETATSNPGDVSSSQTEETKVDDSTETDPQQSETEKVPQDPTEVDDRHHEVKFAISQDSKDPEEDEKVADDLSLKEEVTNAEPAGTGDGVAPAEQRSGER